MFLKNVKHSPLIPLFNNLYHKSFLQTSSNAFLKLIKAQKGFVFLFFFFWHTSRYISSVKNVPIIFDTVYAERQDESEVVSFSIHKMQMLFECFLSNPSYENRKGSSCWEKKNISLYNEINIISSPNISLFGFSAF